jgi:heme O synthase-like polyprenyltransferase
LTLALLPKNLEGYRNAKVPMWPVVSSETQTIHVITVSAILSAALTLLSGIILEIHMLILLPLIGLNIYIIYQAVLNLRDPSQDRTFKIFKMASMLMAFAFLWLFVGVVVSFV